jgi:PAS domain S-box-containing protein
MHSIPKPKTLSITLLYFLIGLVWLFLGTILIGVLDRNTPGTDLRFLYYYKNGIFLFITGVALFFLLRAHSRHVLGAESNYLKLFEGLPGAIYVMEKATFRLLTVNDVMVKKYGYTKEELLNMTALDIRPQKEKERLKEYLRSEHEEGHETGVWLHQKKNGACFYTLISHHSIRFKNLDSYIVIAIDIDKGIKNEQELEKIRWQNSHELRKPVSNLKGLIGLINHHEMVSEDIIQLLNTSVDELDQVLQKINRQETKEKSVV